jgi:flagellar hook-associated protein 2
MATISSLGIGANIDAESIISQLMTLERQPITQAESQISTFNTKLSTWGKIQSAFSSIEDAATALTKDSLWNASKAQSADAEAMTVTAGQGTAPGSYSVQVTSLAQAQFLSTSAYTSKTDVVGDGTLVIELGAYAANPTAPPAQLFTPKADVTAVSIEIGPDDTTLEKVRDKINTATGSSGVSASIVNDASGARLVLRGKTGEANAFRVSVTEGSTPGLSALAYDPSADINNDRLMQSAANAQATINNIPVSSDSNTLSDVVDGLTIKLNKKTTSAVDVTVTQDTDSIKTAIETFSKAYSDAISSIRVQTLYDEGSKTSGPLQGDSTALGLLRQLRNMATSSTSASTVFDRLSSIGLSMRTDGTFATDSSKLSKALENVTELKKMFASTSEDAAAEGIAVRFQKLSDQATSSGGSIATRTDGIKGSIKRTQANVERLELRVDAVETRLRKQYAALDQTSSRLNGLSNYVTQQLSAMNNN